MTFRGFIAVDVPESPALDQLAADLRRASPSLRVDRHPRGDRRRAPIRDPGPRDRRVPKPGPDECHLGRGRGCRTDRKSRRLLGGRSGGPRLSERRPSVEGARHAGPREGPERSRPRPEDPRIPRQRPVRDAHGRRGPPQEERPDPTRGAVFGRGNRPIGIVKVELGPVPYLYLEVRPASLGPESVTAHSFLSARSFSWSHSIVCFSRYFWRTRLRASVTRATSRAFPRP